MAMTYQKGTVCLSGVKVKKWYGKYLTYAKDRDGMKSASTGMFRFARKPIRPNGKRSRCCRRSFLRESGGAGFKTTLPLYDVVTFGWFVKKRYIPTRQGSWSPAYKKTNTYQLNHYLVFHFGDTPLRRLDAFGIQIVLNDLAARGHSEAVVRSCFSNIRAIARLAKKQKHLAEDPAEDVTMPKT